MTEIEPAVVDTDAFSHLFVSRNSQDPRVAAWRGALEGRRILISFQTRAEMLAGALQSGWGDRKVALLRALLDATPTVPSDSEVVDAFAQLTAACRGVGHALQQATHTADRWVAACSISKRIPLLAGDGIYRDAPGLRLLGD